MNEHKVTSPFGGHTAHTLTVARISPDDGVTVAVTKRNSLPGGNRYVETLNAHDHETVRCTACAATDLEGVTGKDPTVHAYTGRLLTQRGCTQECGAMKCNRVPVEMCRKLSLCPRLQTTARTNIVKLKALLKQMPMRCVLHPYCPHSSLLRR